MDKTQAAMQGAILHAIQQHFGCYDDYGLCEYHSEEWDDNDYCTEAAQYAKPATKAAMNFIQYIPKEAEVSHVRDLVQIMAAQEAVNIMRALGMNELEQEQALNAATKLAAVGAMNHPVAIDVFCKIVASGRVTKADLFMLNKYGIEITQ